MEKITKVRLSEFDVLQGLAMILVVLGHHLLPFMPQWYNVMHNYLYTFHMPLFIFISGFLMQYTYRCISDFDAYKTYTKKKARKFIPPYCIIGICCIFLIGEYKSLTAFANELFCLLFSPKQSVTTFLWYIYLLFFYYLLFPIYSRCGKYAKITLFLLSIYGFVQPLNCPYFCLDYFSEYSLFFLIGSYLAMHYQQYKSILFLISPFTLIAFIILTSYRFLTGYHFAVDLLMPIVAIPSFYGLSVMIVKLRCLAKPLEYISTHCFSIYLFHMFLVQSGSLLVMMLSIKMSSMGIILYLLVSIFISILLSSKIYQIIKSVECKVGNKFNVRIR